MLSLAKAAKDYYLRKLGEISPGEDYYLRGGTASGLWRGSAAAELGLSGAVSTEGLVRLFDGQHPGTGEQLGRSLRRDGVAAWDVTFSADKSVSLLWALGDAETRRHVLEAFDEATMSAFGYLESVASSTRGATRTPVIDDQGDPVLDENGTPKLRVETWPIATSGYVAAAFTEFTSRADDPQMHTHVVVANKVKGIDGMWRTIDGRLLYRHQLAAGYLHEAVLRHELTERLGVRWQPVHNGMADIEGFTHHQIEVFSRRRHQLETWRQDQGLPDTPAARQVAVLATRTPKQENPFAELEVEWRERAVDVGLTRDRVERMMGHSGEVKQPDPNELFDSLASPDGLTARASTFGQAEVIKEVAAALSDGGTRGEIEALAETFLATKEVVPLIGGRDVGQADTVADLTEDKLSAIDEPAVADAAARSMRRRDGTTFPGTVHRQYTTAELLATEQRVIEQAISGLGAGRWTAPNLLVEGRLRRHRHLTEGQQEMVRQFATSGNAIDIGVGPAGTGKTAVMTVIGELAMMTGTEIVGTALAGRTAAGLQAATGIPSTTLTRLIGESQQQGGLPRGAVAVVDETGMVGTRQLAVVADLIEAAGGKLILIGDHRQLPEIDAGGLFRALTNRLPAVELTDNIRQQHPWERAALTQLRDGSVDRAIDSYRQQGRVIIGKTQDNTVARAAADWHRYVASTGDLTSGLLIAYDNNTVTKLNQRARTHLAGSGRLHGPALEMGDRVFQAGDRILCRNNQQRLGVLNGDLATVTGVDQGTESLTVRLDRGQDVRQLPPWYLHQGHVDYGYAMTGHKAQGVTTDRTFVIVTGNTDREWAYVAMSRGRQANTLYLANPQPPDEQCTHLTHQGHHDALGALTNALNRGSAQIAACDRAGPERADDLDPPGPPPPGTDIAARVAWQIARHQMERAETERQGPNQDLAIGR